MNRESTGKSVEYLYRRVYDPTLKPAHVGPVNSGIYGKLFL